MQILQRMPIVKCVEVKSPCLKQQWQEQLWAGIATYGVSSCTSYQPGSVGGVKKVIAVRFLLLIGKIVMESSGTTK